MVVSRVIIGVTPFRVLITLLTNLLTKSPAPPSRDLQWLGDSGSCRTLRVIFRKIRREAEVWADPFCMSYISTELGYTRPPPILLFSGGVRGCGTLV